MIEPVDPFKCCQFNRFPVFPWSLSDYRCYASRPRQGACLGNVIREYRREIGEGVETEG